MAARARHPGVPSRCVDCLRARGAGRAARVAARRRRLRAGGLDQGGAGVPASARPSASPAGTTSPTRGCCASSRTWCWCGTRRRSARRASTTTSRPTKIAVTGAQLFDRWFDRQRRRAIARRSARAWGCPTTRPFVLFTGSSSFISESRRRGGVRAALDRRRCAPARDPGAARRQRAGAAASRTTATRGNRTRWPTCRGVAVFPRRGYNPIDADNRADFFDSLYHCGGRRRHQHQRDDRGRDRRPAGAARCWPPSSPARRRARSTSTTCCRSTAASCASRLDARRARRAARRSLGEPGRVRRETQRFVASFIRPHGVDRPATPVFVDALERWPPGRAPAPGAAVWAPLAWAGAGRCALRPGPSTGWRPDRCRRPQACRRGCCTSGRKGARPRGAGWGRALRKGYNGGAAIRAASVHRWQRVRAR